VPATRAHPMMPVSNHDELAEHRFVVAFKSYISAQLDPAVRQLAEDAAQAARDESDRSWPRTSSTRTGFRRCAQARS